MGVSSVLQEHSEEVLRVFEGYSKGGLKMFLGCLKDVLLVIQGF